MRINEHFGVVQGEVVKRNGLRLSIRRHIRIKEADLDRTCRKLWWQENRLGEQFLFGSFCKNRDRLIVTVAAYVPNVGWIVSYR